MISVRQTTLNWQSVAEDACEVLTVRLGKVRNVGVKNIPVKKKLPTKKTGVGNNQVLHLGLAKEPCPLGLQLEEETYWLCTGDSAI